MGRYIRWQAILALTGIALVLAFLGFLSLSRTTIAVRDQSSRYVEGVVGEPQFINPLLMQYNQVDQDLSALLFNGLVKVDGQGNIEPDLARSWEISPDKRRYIFKLRRDVRWHDGEPFTADDVVFTISLMKDPEFPGMPYLSNLWQAISVGKQDDYTVFFDLLEPFPTFVEFTEIGIVPQHLLSDVPVRDLLNHPFNLRPVGTGAFRLDAVNSEFARLSPNPFYFGPKPQLAGIELRFFPSHKTAVAAYANEQINGLGQIPSSLLPEVQDLTTLNLYTAYLSSYNIIYLNLLEAEDLPFFQEADVRRALLHALDRQTIINQALHGQGLIAKGPILPWSWAYNAQQPPVNYDPTAAIGLLNDAGWLDTDGDGIRDKDGVPLAFTLLSSSDTTKRQVAETARQQWQQVGVAVEIEILDSGLSERLANHDFQAALAEVLLGGDPDPYPLWHATQIEGGQNYAGWDNTDASVQLEIGRSLENRGQRNDYYFAFQQIFANEVPSLVLFHPTYIYGVSQDILGVQLMPLSNPSDRFRTVSDWYILTEETIFRESQFNQTAP
ncbi:MAG TPA: peptide ABC transporter substrate-binding protein [Anaerolineae bacterium]|nr:peptide ABC transporter substrate-binding protein [Anaerolineae bacterium]